MSGAASQGLALARLLDGIMREDRGRLLAALVSRLRDVQLAEDALQEAVVSALTHWGRSGLPRSPQGWLLKVALNRAIDLIRKSSRAAKSHSDLVMRAEEAEMVDDPVVIPDERLRLIFTCCHPALEPKSRVALTLRCLGGLSTADIAAVFLDGESAMAQRLTRAKAKISASGIPFSIPDPEDWPERLASVLTVVYLIFTRGYGAGPVQGRDLCEEALFLGRLLVQLAPDDPEIEGCLALMLLTHSRAAARTGPGGETIRPSDQDRSLWNAGLLSDGLDLVDTALRRGRPGAFQIKAAIAACHVKEGGPDWPQIVSLYGELLRHEPTPVVRLNQAVALAEVEGAFVALAMLAPLSKALDGYQPFHATQADLLARTGSIAESHAAYDRAISLAANPADAAFLTKRRSALPIINAPGR